MVSQFVSPHKVGLLGDLDFKFPEHTHAIGRLDNTSEGLLILTTDKKLTRLLYSGDKKHERRYLVMVRNEISSETLELLREGISIPVEAGEPYIAKPVSVEIISHATNVYAYAQDPREAYPHTWLLITLTEGEFRQVRKMVMAARHWCLRLMRISIGNLVLSNLRPGEVGEVEKGFLFTSIGMEEA